MERVSAFLVKRRFVLLAVFVALAVAGVILSGFVVKNKDMKKYLPADSDTKIGFELMGEVFPEDDETSDLRVMYKGLSDGEKTEMLTRLSEIDGVASVAYDGTERYNRDGYTLYRITVDGSAASKIAAAVYKTAVKISDGREVYFAGDVYLHNIPILPPWVMLLAIGIVTTVLLIMCDSFAAPFLFIAGILVAIAINTGSNIIFGEISAITDSIASILQLALSMDYSIMLMERYRQERAKTDDKNAALKNAITASLPAISGSAQTTVVGLLTLVFMSFTVGRDIGLVLAKGVLISMLCVFCVLPALINIFDKLIIKTRKKAPEFKTDGYASFIYKAKVPLSCVFAAVFVAACFLQGNQKITYTGSELDHISTVFGNENDIVLVYKNEYANALAPLQAEIEKDDGVIVVLSCENTMEKPLRYDEVRAKCASAGIRIDIDDSLIKLVYYRNANPTETHMLTAGDFVSFVLRATENIPALEGYAASVRDRLNILSRLSTPEAVNKNYTSGEMAEILGVEPDRLVLLYAYARRDEMSPLELTDAVLGGSALIRAAAGSELIDSITVLDRYMKAVDGGEALSFDGMSEIFDGTGVTKTLTEAIYALCGSETDAVENTLSLKALLSYLTDDFSSDAAFSGFISEEMKQMLASGAEALGSAEALLKKEEYSRALIRTTYPEEGSDTFAFVARTREILSDFDDKEVYLVGNSTYAEEMNAGFKGEYTLIAVLTMAAILIIVLLTFRSPMIPVILVAVIQCAVYTTMSIMNLSGATIYFLAILIMQSILMGATIDYAILFTSYYREIRRTSDKKQALLMTYRKSIGTILTSAIILTFGTLIVGWFAIDLVSKICLSIAYGTVSATVLILVFAPAMISLFDRFVANKKSAENNDTTDTETSQ